MGLTCWGDGLTPSSGQQALLCLCFCESSQGTRARLVLPISLQGEVGPGLDSACCSQPISNHSPNTQAPRPSLGTSLPHW